MSDGGKLFTLNQYIDPNKNDKLKDLGLSKINGIHTYKDRDYIIYDVESDKMSNFMRNRDEIEGDLVDRSQFELKNEEGELPPPLTEAAALNDPNALHAPIPAPITASVATGGTKGKKPSSKSKSKKEKK